MWKIERTVKKGDYLYAVVPNHPYAIAFGYVLEHRVVMENHLGRTLKAGEVVHHLNGNKKDNRIENLQVMSAGEHSSHHGSDKGIKMCCLKCPECSKVFHRPKRQTYLQKGGAYSCCSSTCSGKFSGKVLFQSSNPEVQQALASNLMFEYKSNEYPLPTGGNP